MKNTYAEKSCRNCKNFKPYKIYKFSQNILIAGICNKMKGLKCSECTPEEICTLWQKSEE